MTVSIIDFFDRWRSHPVEAIGSGRNHYVVVPDDANDLPYQPKRLLFFAAGNVKIRDEKGTEIVYTVNVGDMYDFRAVRILAAGTTVAASSIVAWY